MHAGTRPTSIFRTGGRNNSITSSRSQRIAMSNGVSPPSLRVSESAPASSSIVTTASCQVPAGCSAHRVRAHRRARRRNTWPCGCAYADRFGRRERWGAGRVPTRDRRSSTPGYAASLRILPAAGGAVVAHRQVVAVRQIPRACEDGVACSSGLPIRSPSLASAVFASANVASMVCISPFALVPLALASAFPPDSCRMTAPRTTAGTSNLRAASSINDR